MFEKVLFPTDFSSRADVMLDCVASFPQVREVMLLHVIKETLHPMGADVVDRLAKEIAEPKLAEARRYLGSLNPAVRVTMETMVASGIPDGILAAAEKSGADLIVISAHEMHVKEEAILGGVLPTLLCRPGRTSILFMRHRLVETLKGLTYEKFCPLLFSRVLCPTDFSRFSEEAITRAASLEGLGDVTLLHVVPTEGTAAEVAASVSAAGDRLGTTCDSLAARGVRCRKTVTSGDPAGEIVRTAEALDASVIWISAAGKGCLRDFFLGSTVQDVAMQSARPVLVVRPER
jgi:nucleotide-binding universal stress UspA family protein